MTTSLGWCLLSLKGHEGDARVARRNESDGIVLEIEGVRVLVPAKFAPDHLGRVLSAIKAST